MKILQNYKKIVSELFEVDDEKIIKYKDKDGENKEMPAQSAKTMPDEHPAKQAWNKEKDKEDGGEEKPSGQKLGGSDFSRDGGDDRDAQNQKDADAWASKMFGAEKDKVTGKSDDAEPKSDDTPKDKSKEDNMKGVPSQFPEFELAEEPFDHDDYDEDMENEIADEVVAYFVDNIDKEAMKDYTEEEIQDFANRESEKLVAKYQQPDGVPNEKRSMLAYRNDLIDNIRFELGYADGEAGFDADDEPKESVQPKKTPFLKEQLERFGGGKY